MPIRFPVFPAFPKRQSFVCAVHQSRMILPMEEQKKSGIAIKKLSDVITPGEAAYYLESHSYNAYNVGSNNSIGFRHGAKDPRIPTVTENFNYPRILKGKTNVTFVDGHVAAYGSNALFDRKPGLDPLYHLKAGITFR